VAAPVTSRMDPRYLNLLTALICPVSVTIPAPRSSVKYSVFPKLICSPYFLHSSTSFLTIYSASRRRVAQSVQCVTMDWTIGQLGFDPRQGQRIFPLSSVSRPAMGPTQPPVQWVPCVIQLI
jgi:hypothetical protein